MQKRIDFLVSISFSDVFKGQTIKEWIYEVIVSPKIRTKNCQVFCPQKVCNISLILILIDALIDSSFLLFHLIFAAFIIFSESAGIKAQINQLYSFYPKKGALIKQKFCLFRDHVVCNLQSTSWNEIICKGAFTISYVLAFSRDLLHLF